MIKKLYILNIIITLSLLGCNSMKIIGNIKKIRTIFLKKSNYFSIKSEKS